MSRKLDMTYDRGGCDKLLNNDAGVVVTLSPHNYAVDEFHGDPLVAGSNGATNAMRQTPTHELPEFSWRDDAVAAQFLLVELDHSVVSQLPATVDENMIESPCGADSVLCSKASNRPSSMASPNSCRHSL